MEFKTSNLVWTRPPKVYKIEEKKITMTTEPNTDLWQRTYYGFQNDNAPVLQMKTSEKFFSFVVKTEFESKTRFDQSGVVMYLAVYMYKKGTPLGIIFGIPLFIFCGYQHCIANIITLGVARTFDLSMFICIIGNLVGSLFLWFLSRNIKK